jgi:uncharacterized membrane protein
MQIALVIALSLHVLSSVFWAGSSFTLARTGGAGGELLFGPQMGAAGVAILTGGYLGHLVHAGAFGTAEMILAAGAFCALVAAFVQAAIGGRAVRALRNGTAEAPASRSRIATAQRVAAALLAVTALCMGAARYI